MENKIYNEPNLDTMKRMRNGYLDLTVTSPPYDQLRVYKGYSTKDEIAFEHPAIFPEKLAADHIYTWSNPGDIVYDPFGGSGTTVKEAHLMKRNWLMSEISKEYCVIAEKRIEPYLTQQTLNL